MLDIGWSELLVIGVVALIVVGPKDLPKLFRQLGQWVGQARRLAREFQHAMNEAADESGMTEIKKSFDQAASVKNMGLDNWDKAMPDPATPAKPAKGDADPKAAEATSPQPDPGAPKPAATEPAAEKPTTKKSPAKKPAAKTKTKAKTPASKAPAKASVKKSATKAAAKKPAAKKPAPKKAAT